MKVTVRYEGGRSFGNVSDTSDYELRIERSSERSVNLYIRFPGAAGGRGIGENQGYVSDASIDLGSDHAKKLAVGILSALEQPCPSLLPLAFGTSAQEPRSQLIVGLKRLTEPVNLFVLASSDGRTLQTMSCGSKALYFTGAPQHWNERSGHFASQFWNKTATRRDQVTSAPWRDHYQEQIDQLELPS